MYDRDRRQFGQNFLVDHEVVTGIVDDVDPRPEGTVIEIGPGAAALTEPLCQRAGRVVAIEIDPKWAEKLPRKVGGGANLEVVNRDALLVDLDPWFDPHPGDLKPALCGNLPYNRASAILIRFLPHIAKFRHFVFMVQWEVAKRVCASPGGRAYGSLSVIVANYAIPEIRLKIGPDSFRPRPKVHSGTFRLVGRPEPFVADPLFPWFVRAAFRQKRKTLRNSLLMTFSAPEVDAAIEACSFKPAIRAEELSLEMFAALFEAFRPRLEEIRSQGAVPSALDEDE
ncbi:MAG: ribosomal RNA small subunit methyltransferase A [Fibrobacteria bacterium]|nr:ribosomal RNA small subunit methyltransferase A [Fibrobacteria bacterium]